MRASTILCALLVSVAVVLATPPRATTTRAQTTTTTTTRAPSTTTTTRAPTTTTNIPITSTSAPSPLDGIVFNQAFVPVFLPYVQIQPVTIGVRSIAMMSEVKFDAWAAYHPTAVGRFTGSRLRRPVVEHTTRNKNIAIAYAAYRLGCDILPAACPQLVQVMIGLGLDPNNTSTDPSTPAGVGNACSKAQLAWRHADGMNQLGDAEGRQYLRRNFSDPSGYVPVNNYHTISDPDAWQPNIETDSVDGREIARTYTTPQTGTMKTFAVNVTDPRYFVPNQRSRYSASRGLYRQKVNDIIDSVASITEYRKLSAELWDNKFDGLLKLGSHIHATYGNGTLDAQSVMHMIFNTAGYESMSLMWHFKTRYNAERPFTGVRFLKSGQTIRGYGGPGVGVVDMDGSEFRSYLRTDSFPDYPSGTSCLCNAWIASIKHYIGSDNINFARSWAPGTSSREPGLTPATPFTIAYTSLDDAAAECAMTRFWSGVHYKPAVEAPVEACKALGVSVAQKVMRMIAGTETRPTSA